MGDPHLVTTHFAERVFARACKHGVFERTQDVSRSPSQSGKLRCTSRHVSGVMSCSSRTIPLRGILSVCP